MITKLLYVPSITDYVKEHLIRQIIERSNPPAFTERKKKK